MTNEIKVLIGIAVIIVGAGIGLSILSGGPSATAPAGEAVNGDTLVRESSPSIGGGSNAKVQLVEFADYQCPACAAVHPLVKEVLAAYADNADVNYTFRDFPLEQIHPQARIAAEAAHAAGDQGKYWEMSDLLYTRQDEWAGNAEVLSVFNSFAQEIGVADIDAFKLSIQQRKFQDVIDQGADDGTASGVNSTPTFFLNGQLTSARSLEQFQTEIDALLAETTGAAAAGDAMEADGAVMEADGAVMEAKPVEVETAPIQ